MNKPGPKKGTPKQEAFVREYLIDLNASAAYRRAGYVTGNANVLGPRLLANAGIAKAIQEAMDKRAERVEIDADYVLKNIKSIGERCMQREPLMRGTGKERKQVKEFVEDPETGEEVLADVWTFDSQGALKAQELLGKHLKLFTDKTEVSGSVTVQASETDEKL
jgi:phage terminase small subunit